MYVYKYLHGFIHRSSSRPAHGLLAYLQHRGGVQDREGQASDMERHQGPLGTKSDLCPYVRMLVCVRICMCIYIYTCLYAHTLKIHIYIYVCTSIDIEVYTYAYRTRAIEPNPTLTAA